MKKPIKFFLITGIVIVIGLFGVYIFKGRNQETIHVKHNVTKVSAPVRKIYTTDAATFKLSPESLSDSEKNSRNKLESFLKENMLVNGGFVTNYKAHKDQNKTELATGHDQLSESAGLWLRNLALTGTQKQFDAFYKETKKKFFADGQFTYRINADGKRSDVNASIDDMRIISALIEAEQRFKDPKYQKEIKSLVSTFKKQSIQNGMLVDFYDVKTKKPAHQISLYYLDIKDMGYIYKVAGLSPKDLEFEYHILKNGYISNSFPLYHTQYNYDTGKYEDSKQINIIESLLSILYLSEIGQEKSQSIQFVKNAVTTGTLYNSYNLDGTPADKSQSAASYAIAAMIGKEIGDQKLYQQAIQIVQNFQITDPSSPIYGGIGDPNTLQVYSYNNLMALLAYDY
ncbi:hypothetical protein [Ligilactobacillus aviarius]|uniref:hypothetical protein n=1 Tax=Ligilactobacillus aviarius TaxID=1606 RepID=UPI0024B9D21C|nr:hypothetical protein [Ligilactobacillus aviarius]